MQKAATLPKEQRKLSFADWFTLLFTGLYLLVEWIPNLGAIEFMGPQWLYLSLLAAVVAGYIIFYDRSHHPGVDRIGSSTISVVYLSLFLLSGLSILAAINPTESIVCYARFVVTVTSFFNMAVLLHRRTRVIPVLLFLVAISVLLQSLQALMDFLAGFHDTPLNQLLLGIKGNMGNKNILAASLMVKLAFVMFGIFRSRSVSRGFYIFVCILGAATVFLLNARAAYIGIILETVLCVLICFVMPGRPGENRQRATIQRVGGIVVPILLALFISQALLFSALQENTGPSKYGLVSDRLVELSFSNNSSTGRLDLWKAALSYSKEHPLMGCGYGNWKLVSIPYEKTIVNDEVIAKHVHNDFLEIPAETGILGGLLYISIFIVAFICTIRSFYSSAERETKLLSLFSLVALAGYAVDSLFNFPIDRPNMQMLFALILALNLDSFLMVPSKTPSATSTKKWWRPAFALNLFVLMPVAIWLCFSTYRSLVVQYQTDEDMALDVPVNNSSINAAFPSIPNLAKSAIPIDAIKARYLMLEKKYDQALVLLNNSIRVNPYIMYNEYLKAYIFFMQNRFDSAYFYSKKAFYNKPRSGQYYRTFTTICAQLRDTTDLRQAFELYTSYRKEPEPWVLYTDALRYLQYPVATVSALTDSALRLFPGDTSLRLRSAALHTITPAVSSSVAPASYFEMATAAFRAENYPVAARDFILASEAHTGGYVSMENAGLCYLAMKQYQKAIACFNTVIGSGASSDGKSECYRGICLYDLGKKEEGCRSLQAAAAKKYPEAMTLLAKNCR